MSLAVVHILMRMPEAPRLPLPPPQPLPTRASYSRYSRLRLNAFSSLLKRPVHSQSFYPPHPPPKRKPFHFPLSLNPLDFHRLPFWLSLNSSSWLRATLPTSQLFKFPRVVGVPGYYVNIVCAKIVKLSHPPMTFTCHPFALLILIVPNSRSFRCAWNVPILWFLS